MILKQNASKLELKGKWPFLVTKFSEKLKLTLLMMRICYEDDWWWWLLTSGLVNLGDGGWLACQSFVAGLLRLKLPYRGVEGGVEVAHVVEQADLVGGVGVVGRRLGAGDRGAGLKENLRRLRRFGGLRWLYLGFWLVWLSWPGLLPGPSSSAPV